MPSRPLLATTTAIATLALAACKSAVVDDGSAIPGLTIVSGDAQTGVAGEALPSPLVVRLGNVHGDPAGGATIGWYVVDGGGRVAASSSITDAEGLASTTFTLGAVEGLEQAVDARVLLPGLNALPDPKQVAFAATITPTATPPTALTWTAAQLPAIPSCANATWSDIWAASATEVFAVGGCGTIRHFTGSSWESQSSGSTRNLYSVWGRSPADVFAVGDSATVLHYDGTTWSEVSGLPLGVVSGVWGSLTGELFVVTRDSVVKGHVWRHDDAGWTVQFNRMCPLNAIGGTSSSNVFAVGVGSPVRYDGSSWSGGGCSALSGRHDVAGGASGEVYAVGSDTEFEGCTRGGGCPTSAVVVEHDATGWQRRLTLLRYPSFRGVWVGSGDEVVVVGANGLIIHSDGPRWRLEPSGTSATIITVTGNVPTSLWALAGGGLVLHGTRANAAPSASPR